jgi:hypothetical protein
VCPGWGAGQAEPSANQPVTSSVFALVLSGEYDPITPPAWGQKAAKTLENAYAFEFAGVGHGVSGKTGCPQKLLAAFWTDPSTRPDVACPEATSP